MQCGNCQGLQLVQQLLLGVQGGHGGVRLQEHPELLCLAVPELIQNCLTGYPCGSLVPIKFGFEKVPFTLCCTEVYLWSLNRGWFGANCLMLTMTWSSLWVSHLGVQAEAVHHQLPGRHFVWGFKDTCWGCTLLLRWWNHCDLTCLISLNKGTSIRPMLLKEYMSKTPLRKQMFCKRIR